MVHGLAADRIIILTVNQFMEHAIGWTISWDSPVIFIHEAVLTKILYARKICCGWWSLTPFW